MFQWPPVELMIDLRFVLPPDLMNQMTDYNAARIIGERKFSVLYDVPAPGTLRWLASKTYCLLTRETLSRLKLLL